MEGLRIEYKASLSRQVLNGLDSDMAAFANAKGGEIWFGIDDTGRPTGQGLSEKERQYVAQRAASCRPPITVDFDDREHDGHPITAVIVRESLSVHTDGRHRFPVRSGGLKSYLDVTGILLLARAKGLEFASGQVGLGWGQINAKAKRIEVPDDITQHFVKALSCDNPAVRNEALKDLDAALHRYEFEREPRIMEALITLAERLAEPTNGRPLDLLRYILLQASEEDRATRVPKIRERALALCLSTGVGFVAQQALNFVSEFPEERDVETILWILDS